MRRLTLLGLLLVACGDGGGSSSSTTGDGGAVAAEGGSATSTSSSQCPSGKLQLAFSDDRRPSREACMATSSIAHGSANAATLITIREGTQAAPTSWIVVQVDGATETRPNLVTFNISPSEPATTFSRTCSSAPCAELQVGPSQVYESGRSVVFSGLKLTSGAGGGDVTLTGQLDAR